MRKIISLLLCLILVFSMTIPTFAESNDETIKVKLCNYTDVNGKWVGEKYIKFDVEPQIIDGRTMVPIRAVAEELGYKVDWVDNNGIKLVTIFKELGEPNMKDMNTYLDKYAQYKDCVYLFRQLDKGKNPTSFKYFDSSFSIDVSKPKKVGVEYSTGLLKSIDDILYNCDRTTIEAGFYVKSSTNHKAYVDLVGWEKNYRHVKEYAFSLDVDPTIIKGRTLIPLRAAGELLGLKVDWNNKTRTVIITA